MLNCATNSFAFSEASLALRSVSRADSVFAAAAATSLVSFCFNSNHRLRSAGAESIAFFFLAKPILVSCTCATNSSLRDAPASEHVFAQVTRPPYRSSPPSQQSHTPSFTLDDGIDSDCAPLLLQWKEPLEHALVPGSSVPSAQSQ